VGYTSRRDRKKEPQIVSAKAYRHKKTLFFIIFFYVYLLLSLSVRKSERFYYMLHRRCHMILCAAASKTTPPTPPTTGSGAAPRPPRMRMAEPMPTKDRFPPALYNSIDPRRRLACLIDGNTVTPRMYLPLVQSIVKKDSVALLHRVFAHDMTQEWKDAIEETNGYEAFRVETFIPISMQMGADAHHIAEYRNDNKFQGIVYVCAPEDLVRFKKFFPRLAGIGLHQRIVDSSMNEVISDA